MGKFKYYIISLGILISFIIILLLYINFFDEKIIITLFGDSTISLYEGENYFEDGYIALNDSGDNITSRVKVTSNYNKDIPGSYKITYTIKTRFRTFIKERKLIVASDPLSYINFKLKGSSIINLRIGEKYIDSGFTCINRNTKEDLSKRVLVESDVNINKSGSYTIKYNLKYDGKEKVLVRKINVYKDKYLYSISTVNPTNKPVELNFESFIRNYSHVICPNGTLKKTNKFTYYFFQNGEYEFYIYDHSNDYEVFTIKIENIDKVAPTGTCTAILKNGISVYNVISNDKDIEYYYYNGEAKHKSKESLYKVDYYLRNGSVLLKDYASNQTLIKCAVSRSYMPVYETDIKKFDYSYKSDSLVINALKKDGYVLSYIWAKDPYLQMRKEVVDKSKGVFVLPGKTLETAIKKNKLEGKIVYGSNASAGVLKDQYYPNIYRDDAKYNLMEPSAFTVLNGKVIMNDYKNYYGHAPILYIDGGNRLSFVPNLTELKSAERKKIFDDIIDNGVMNTFAFGPILLIDYKEQPVTNDYYALRNTFCQINENNFVQIVSDTKRWNLDEMPKIMKELNCKNAYNFDGGGSVAAFVKGRNQSLKTLAGNQRKLIGVMYFTEL